MTALGVADGALIAGGVFKTIGTAAHASVTAFDAATGQPLPWDAGLRPGDVTPLAVWCIESEEGTVCLGGNFSAAGAEPQAFIASFS